jgi:hypothetical protein
MLTRAINEIIVQKMDRSKSPSHCRKEKEFQLLPFENGGLGKSY